MIQKGFQSSPRAALAAWGPIVILSAVSGAMLLLPPAWVAVLRYERGAVGRGEWWRLITANFLHLGVWHYLLNVASLVLLALLCPEREAWRHWILQVLVVAAGTCTGLYFGAPAVIFYVGLSGMIYGLFLLGLGRQALNGDRIAMLCLAFLIGRVAWEFIVGIPASEERLIGGRVVPQSHLSGMVAALIYAAAAGLIQKINALRHKMPQAL